MTDAEKNYVIAQTLRGVTPMNPARSVVEDFGVIEGFPYVIMFMDLGTRNGYLGIDVKSRKQEELDVLEYDIRVYGGITYNSFSAPAKGLMLGLYWLGFDCNHIDDLPDLDGIRTNFGEAMYEARKGLEASFSDPSDPLGIPKTIKDQEFVMRQIAYMVPQVRKRGYRPIFKED